MISSSSYHTYKILKEEKMAKKKRTLPITIIAFTVFFLSSILVSNSSLSKAPSISASKNCKECHEETYNHWKNAMEQKHTKKEILSILNDLKVAGIATSGGDHIRICQMASGVNPNIQ